MHIRRSGLPLLAGLALAATACKETTVPFYDSPTVEQYSVIRTRSQLQNLAIGLLNGDRQLHDFQILLDETVARDVYRLDGAEPRYISSPLGPAPIPDINFVGSSIFLGPYTNIRTATLLVSATEASEAARPTPLTDEEKLAVYGYGNTIKALQYIRLIQQRDTIGLPIFSGGTGLDPIHCKNDVLLYTAALLDTAAQQLEDASAAGQDALPFALPAGFDDFHDVDAFRQLTRAFAAKVDLYLAYRAYSLGGTIDAAYLDSARVALNESFFETGPSADLSLGPVYTYSTSSGDYVQPNFNKDIIRINPKVVDSAEAGDTRLAEKVELDPTIVAASVVEQADASSGYLDKIYTSPTSPLPLLRNDELILMSAQIYAGQNDLANAANEVNVIRNAAGLGDVAFADRTAALREIVRQERYQLLFESVARYVDARMFGLLQDFGLERGKGAKTSTDPASDDFQGYAPVPVFPFPNTELLARNNDVSRTCDNP